MKLRNTSTIISYNYLQNSLTKIYRRETIQYNKVMKKAQYLHLLLNFLIMFNEKCNALIAKNIVTLYGRRP